MHIVVKQHRVTYFSIIIFAYPQAISFTVVVNTFRFNMAIVKIILIQTLMLAESRISVVNNAYEMVLFLVIAGYLIKAIVHFACSGDYCFRFWYHVHILIKIKSSCCLAKTS